MSQQGKGFLTDAELARLAALQVELRDQIVRGVITFDDVEKVLRPPKKLDLGDDDHFCCCDHD